MKGGSKKLRRLSPDNGNGKFNGPYKCPDLCLRNWLSRRSGERFKKVASKGGWWD